MKRPALILLLVALGSWACLTLSPQYKLGTRAEMGHNWDEAIRFYEKASLEHPNDPVYRAALERARVSASLDAVREARRFALEGKADEAKAAYAKAIDYNPRDTGLVLEARSFATAGAAPAEPAPEKIEFPIKLKPKEEAIELRFPNTTQVRAILDALGRAAGVNIIYDATFRDGPFQTTMSGQTFEQALASICLATKNFYRIVDEKTVIVAPDNPMMRLQYEPECIKTFYLSNVVAQDMVTAITGMVRSNLKAPQITSDKQLNSITVRDTASHVELIERLIRLWDKPKAEVFVDVEIMEVSRSKLRQLGLSFDQNSASLRYGSSADTDTSAGGWFNLKDVNPGNAGNWYVSLPLALVQVLEQDGETKVLAQPRLRGLSGEDISNKIGQKVPIPNTTFSTFAGGGVNNVPITSYTLTDVGLEMKIKPTVHIEGEVTLEVEIKVTSIAGTGYADIPIMSNREFKSIIRLKDGETNLVTGLLRDEERRIIKGIPGLKDIPVLGRLFGAEDTVIEQADVIMTLTPHIIRRVPLKPEDRKALWLDVGAIGGGGAAGGAELDVPQPGLGRPLPGLVPPAPAAQPAGPSEIMLSPASFELPAGRDLAMAVNVRTSEALANVSLTLSFDPRVLELKGVQSAVRPSTTGAAPFLSRYDNASGSAIIGFTSPDATKGTTGGWTLATLSFTAKAPGEAIVGVASVTATSIGGRPIVFQTGQSRIIVR